MYGGNTMPTTDSPVRVEMRKVAFWRGKRDPFLLFFTGSA